MSGISSCREPSRKRSGVNAFAIGGGGRGRGAATEHLTEPVFVLLVFGDCARLLGKRDHRAGAVTPPSRAIVLLCELSMQVEGKGSERCGRTAEPITSEKSGSFA